MKQAKKLIEVSLPLKAINEEGSQRKRKSPGGYPTTLHKWWAQRPVAAARGPEDIVKRLKVGLEPLAGYENHDGVLVTNGVDTMYEHSETWTFKSGEQGVLRFVTVHKVQDGKITLWKDYWDMNGLTGFAPPTWLEDLAAADMSWVFDATGLI